MKCEVADVKIPAASVLMPVYNNAPFLDEAVSSILGQSFADFELIIVDDGSDDGSAAILAAWAGRDCRIRVLSNEGNRGIVHSLNRGLAECRGAYVVRMDSDDIALPDRLARQIGTMDADPGIVVLGAAVTCIDAAGREIGMVRHSLADCPLLRQNTMIHPTVVIRREVLVRHGLSYLEKYRYAEDYFLWLQLSRFGRLAAIDDVVLRYRTSGTASRVRHLKAMLRATLRVKLAGAFTLGFLPSVADAGRFLLECALLLLPAALVLRLYLRLTFGKGTKVHL